MIKSLPTEERPREKMILGGSASLSNAELMAIILRTGTRKKSAISLAEEVFRFCENDISELRQMSLESFCEIDGIGFSKACQIKAAIELGFRMNAVKISYGQKISSPLDIVNTFIHELSNEKIEKFIVVFLTTKNEIIGWEVISQGSLNASIVHPREVFNKAIRKSAASIIAVHNHPSGYTNPSKEDLLITERLAEAGKLLGIDLLDHIIVGIKGYYSFKEHHTF